MEPEQLANFIADTLSDRKAEDILILDVEALVGYASYFVVCTGRSDRQVSALADHTVRRLRTELGVRPLGTEGVARSPWALLDYGDVVVHVFRQDERDFYDLEGLWADAPRVIYEPVAPPARPAPAPLR
jgi:ribosome-associated protein